MAPGPVARVLRVRVRGVLVPAALAAARVVVRVRAAIALMRRAAKAISATKPVVRVVPGRRVHVKVDKARAKASSAHRVRMDIRATRPAFLPITPTPEPITRTASSRARHVRKARVRVATVLTTTQARARMARVPAVHVVQAARRAAAIAVRAAAAKANETGRESALLSVGG